MRKNQQSGSCLLFNVQGGAVSQIFDLKEGDNLIGSSKDICDVVIAQSGISDIHAKITLENQTGECSIEDLGSEQGIYKINKDKIQKLKMGKIYDLLDQVPFLIGKFQCIFRVSKQDYEHEVSDTRLERSFSANEIISFGSPNQFNKSSSKSLNFQNLNDFILSAQSDRISNEKAGQNNQEPNIHADLLMQIFNQIQINHSKRISSPSGKNKKNEDSPLIEISNASAVDQENKSNDSRLQIEISQGTPFQSASPLPKDQKSTNFIIKNLIPKKPIKKLDFVNQPQKNEKKLNKLETKSDGDIESIQSYDSFDQKHCIFQQDQIMDITQVPDLVVDRRNKVKIADKKEVKQQKKTTQDIQLIHLQNREDVQDILELQSKLQRQNKQKHVKLNKFNEQNDSFSIVQNKSKQIEQKQIEQKQIEQKQIQNEVFIQIDKQQVKIKQSKKENIIKTDQIFDKLIQINQKNQEALSIEQNKEKQKISKSIKQNKQNDVKVSINLKQDENNLKDKIIIQDNQSQAQVKKNNKKVQSYEDILNFTQNSQTQINDLIEQNKEKQKSSKSIKKNGIKVRMIQDDNNTQLKINDNQTQAQIKQNNNKFQMNEDILNVTQNSQTQINDLIEQNKEKQKTSKSIKKNGIKVRMIQDDNNTQLKINDNQTQAQTKKNNNKVQMNEDILNVTQNSQSQTISQNQIKIEVTQQSQNQLDKPLKSMLKKRKNEIEDKKYFRERCRIGGTPDENSSSQQSMIYNNNSDKKRKVKFEISQEKDSEQKLLQKKKFNQKMIDYSIKEQDKIQKKVKIEQDQIYEKPKRTQKIMFSGFEPSNDEITQLKKIGFIIINDKSKQFDILIMESFIRSIKFLTAISKGVNIVNRKYLNDCLKNQRILDDKQYILNDQLAQKQYKFELKKTLSMVQVQKLFKNMNFWIPSNIEPSYKDVKYLIELNGGKVDKQISKGDQIILINENEKQQYKDFKIYSKELLMTGILQQNIDFNKYKL